MSDKRHLIVPCAVAPSTPSFPGPNLRALLAAMSPLERIACGEDSPAQPYEIALARASGLPGEPGYIPWAAFETGTTGLPCAWIKLCHWQVGVENVVLLPPQDLGVDIATSEALLAAMKPYFEEDGLSLRGFDNMPGTWLATGEMLRGLRTVSIDRLAGRQLSREALNFPGAAASKLRLLQNEMQMLLYTHAANDARQEQRLAPINSFWVTGAGVLDAAVPVNKDVQVESRLCEPARRGDTDALAKAWQEIDNTSFAALLATLRSGGDARLTLCGDYAAQSFVPAPQGLWTKMKIATGLQKAWNGWDQL